VLDVFFVCLTLWLLIGRVVEPHKRLPWLCSVWQWAV